ncbi:MAG: hypothetical protein ACM3N0_03030 [Chloroflexota bacterium]
MVFVYSSKSLKRRFLAYTDLQFSYPNTEGWRQHPVKKFVLIVMMVVALAIPATAVASDGYTNVAGVNEGGGSNGAPAAVASTGEPSSTGILPFTGLQLGLMFGAGVVLLGTGVALRRTRTSR